MSVLSLAERQAAEVALSSIAAAGSTVPQAELYPIWLDRLYAHLAERMFGGRSPLSFEGLPLRPPAEPAAWLGALHQHFLSLQPVATEEGIALLPGPGRKGSGSYYTPLNLVRVLLDHGLDPLIRSALAAPDPEAALLSLRVCDPACGAGGFLVAAAERLAAALAALRGGGMEQAAQDVLCYCIYGVDIDPQAVGLCRLALRCALGAGERAREALEERILCGNALLGTTRADLAGGIPSAAFSRQEGDDPSVLSALRRRHRRELAAMGAPVLDSVEPAALLRAADAWCAAFVWTKDGCMPACITHADLLAALHGEPLPRAQSETVKALSRRHRFFHWGLAFPEVRDAGGFDLMLGNPPFVNAIEGGIDGRLKVFAKHAHPLLRGSADLSYFFLSLCRSLCRPGGRISLVLPRGVLNASSARKLRASMPGELQPELVYAPERSNHFHGAQVFICLLGLGPSGRCRVGVEEPSSADLPSGSIGTDNWWLGMQRILMGLPPEEEAGTRPLSEVFSLRASMITSEYYLIRLADREDGGALKLITTGLIDPGLCLWGRSRCRMLGKDYRHPRILEDESYPPALRRRLQEAGRPKLLVAGLSKRIECFVDAEGGLAGAVSTYTVFHPRDDVEALRRLAAVLLSDEATLRFRMVLGGNAMGGGNTTMTKSFLADFPLPADFPG
jgi:hypothetical protein